MKTIITRGLIFSLVFACTTVLGEVCPDTAAIKAKNLQGWVALDFNDDSPATPQEISQFEKSVTEFYTAEWSEDYEYGPGRCYYNSNADVSLAKVAAKPTGTNWHLQGPVLQCVNSNVTACPFG